jgi:hypothetical protein
LRQATFIGHAQAFTFDAVKALFEQREVSALAEQGQAAVEKFAQVGFLHASVAPIWGWARRSTRVKLKLAFSPGFVGASLLAKSLRAARSFREHASSLTSIASKLAPTGCIALKLTQIDDD